MIILGIDPGSRHMGYCVLELDRGKERAITYGTFSLRSDDAHALRLQQIYAYVDELVDTHHPDECAVEMPIYGKNPQSMLKLGRAQAAAMLPALNHQIPVTQYTPKEVKKSVTGNGNAAKEQVWFMVKAMLKLTEDRGLDASDALAVGLCHAHRLQHGQTQKYKNWSSFVAANPNRIVG